MGLTGYKPGRPFRFSTAWIAVVVKCVTKCAPRHFGILRGRWCCEAVTRRMLREYEIKVSGETVRRWGRRMRRATKLTALRRVLAKLPDDETAVFQHDVDINTSPKIGSMWMVKGRQAKVETPGNNEKRYLSGSIHWRTGQVFLMEGAPK
ncbi:hypothetical protein [Singulisphaera sp. PoT]|uniref:hypothetical protein n=1 Tax=Singulisphaera sp. PoT TaxID=3411797 RepID=UPI003BF45FD9